jgi:hypothetical protein
MGGSVAVLSGQKGDTTINATEIKRDWRSCGTSARLDGSPATAGSRRIYFEDRNHPGAYCWRPASWGTHGTGVHGFRCYGDGTGFDPDTRQDTPDRYPTCEF